MAFGYFPDFADTKPLIDLYLKIIGYPYGSRRNEVRLVFAALAPKDTENILDIGSGDGIWTNQLAHMTTATIYALDTSKKDQATAKKRARLLSLKNVKHQTGDAQHMTFSDTFFDAVYSISTLEHIPDDDAVFFEMYRVIKPGGRAIISVPTDKMLALPALAVRLPKPLKSIFQTSIQTATNAQEYQENNNQRFVHHRLYSLEMIRKKAQKSGMRVTDYRYHISLFGLVPHNIVHSFKLFEWHKNQKSSYSFVNQLVFGLTFPLFYPFYLLDDIVPKMPGMALIVELRKPIQKSPAFQKTRKKKKV